METIEGDIITDEMRKRSRMLEGTNGGVEFRVDEFFIADWLVLKGFIDEFTLWDCQCFMDLRRSWEAFFGVKWGQVRTHEPSMMTAQEVSSMYDLIRREMGIPRCEAIIGLVIEAMMTEATREQNIRAEVADEYRKAMEQIQSALAGANKRKNEIIVESYA
jgi:hypothetical protein